MKLKTTNRNILAKYLTLFLFSSCICFTVSFAQSPKIETIKQQLELTTNSDERIKFNLQLALEYYNLGDIKKALKYAIEAEHSIMPYTENDLRGSVHLYEGNFLLELSKYGDALSHFQISYSAFASENKLDRMTLVLSSLGVVFERLNNPELALEYNRKVIVNRIEMNDSAGLAIAYTNIGNIYEELEKYELAFNYYNDAAYIDSALKNTRDLSVDYNNLGFLFEKLEELNTAMTFYNKSYEIDKELKDIYSQSTVLLNIARINLLRGNIEKAKEKALLSLELTEKTGSIRNLSENYDLLSQIEKKANNSAGSFKYYRKYLKLEDSISNELQAINDETLRAAPINNLKEEKTKSILGKGGIEDLAFYILTLILLAVVVFMLIKLFKK